MVNIEHQTAIKSDELVKSKGVLALVTARGGSKGLPRKNILLAGGKPLIGWTIAAGIESKVIDRIVLSSDDDEIIATARELGCEIPFRRPAELASDTASSMDVVLHALDQLPGFEYVILLQPTSPLRTADDIDAAFGLMLASGAQSCVSVCEVEESPYWMYRLTDEGRLQSLFPPIEGLTRRQDLPSVYVLNGAIYIARVDWLRENRSFIDENTIAYQMSKDHSIDIDTAEDFAAFCSRVE